ncbi:MAG: preprotein translocase subunit SecG [bacterium]|nr:preprotein translocase subunit SecG [bacterium]
MFQIILVVHIAICLFLIILVLLQQGKGADAGATFGGSSNTLFGASGASTVLTKATTASAIAFIVTSIFLVKLYPSSINTGGVASDVLAGSVMAPKAADTATTSEEKTDTSALAVTEKIPNEKTEAPVVTNTKPTTESKTTKK